MPTMKLGGHVRYLDGKPAKKVRLRIYDRDVGNPSDKILDLKTKSNGTFKKVSKDWKDTILDTAVLRYRVDAHGKVYRGFFAPLGAYKSIPITLPRSSPKPASHVSKSQRELIHLIDLASSYEGHARETLYDIVEFGAEALTRTIAEPHYQKATYLVGPNATLSKLRSAINRATKNPKTKAVDLFVSPHGAPANSAEDKGKIAFYGNKQKTMIQVRDELRKIPASQRKKLRIVFSTACYGKDHIDAWLGAGFEAASGSTGVYADSPLSQPAFLTKWVSGGSFASAVAAANAADPARAIDGIAKAYYLGESEPSSAKAVNSHRSRKGDGRLKIDERPY